MARIGCMYHRAPFGFCLMILNLHTVSLEESARSTDVPDRPRSACFVSILPLAFFAYEHFIFIARHRQCSVLSDKVPDISTCEFIPQESARSNTIGAQCMTGFSFELD